MRKHCDLAVAYILKVLWVKRTDLCQVIAAGGVLHLRGLMLLAVAPFDVIGGFPMLRRQEHITGFTMFNHFAHQHEYAFLAGTTGLGHVVSHYQDGVFAAKIPQQFFHRFGAFSGPLFFPVNAFPLCILQPRIPVQNNYPKPLPLLQIRGPR